MGISELRHLRRSHHGREANLKTLGKDLVRTGAITKSDAALAEMVARHCDASLDRILRAEGLVNEDTLLDAHARRTGARRLSAEDVGRSHPVDSGLDPRLLLKHAILPMRRDDDGMLAIATSTPEGLRAVRSLLPDVLQRAVAIIAPRSAIQDQVALQNREALRSLAEARVAESESCRGWAHQFGWRLGVTMVVLSAILAWSILYPAVVFGVLALWAVVTLVVAALLRMAALVAKLTEPEKAAGAVSALAPLPRVSILVPLYRETEIAHALVVRLSALTYPKCLLDVILVLEEEDVLTQRTLAGIDLPPWIRPVIVPDGKPRTKPRAMNYALDFCEGDIIGIFDAEDAPDPDQITRIARRFQQLPRETACLQGILDYYNPRQNWLARCFTIEYAAWFRVMMPGMARLGLAIPLGGTSLYFRRDVLEELGGWDAHNVTEDADLGFRLARHGYRTEMIETVTEEEANCRAWPWIKQRSRWLKGYMTTYLVHMRQPLLLYRQLGARKFWGFQAHFVTALSQFVLAPFLWSFWLLFFGLPHPLQPYLPAGALIGMGSLFVAVEMLNIVIYISAVTKPKHRHLLPWVPTMHFYTPLGAIAAYKALYELILRPFFWDKTAHGLSLAARPVVPSGKGADLSGIEFEPGHKGP